MRTKLDNAIDQYFVYKRKLTKM